MMAVPPIVIKALASAATDKRTWKAVAVIVTALLMPFIISILLLAALFSGIAGENKNMLDYSFKNARIPGSFNSDQRGAIEDMRDRLGELDEIISEKEENSLDGSMVKAAFYCLNFGKELDEEFDFNKFCECFEGAEIKQLDEALKALSEEFSQYEITGNLRYSVEKTYEYLKGK